MANNWLIEQTIDLQRGVQAPLVWPNALMLCGDNNAHTWRVMIMDGGESAQITGNITGYFVRTDGNTVTVTGGLTGNVATVTLPQACYATDGDLYAVMRLKSSSGMITLSALILPVRNVLTDSIIDPGEVIPSLDDLLAQIDACEEATDAANDAADAANQAAQSASAVESDIESAEAARVTAEQGRVAGEQARAAAEAERVANEDERQQQLTDAINAAEADADRAEAAADAAETLIAMPPLFSDTPPADEPTLNKLWVDTGVSPTMMRRWRGADVPTAREYEETRVGRGKNLLNDAEIAPSNAANTTVTRDGHVMRIQGTNATYRSGQIDVYLPAGTYTIKADITVTSGVARIARRVSADGGKTYPSVITDSSPSGAEGYTFTVSQGGWNRFSFYATWTTVEDGDVTYSNIRLYAGMEAAAFEPYEGVPFLAIDNGVGQMQSVALAVGCHAIQSGTGEASPSNVRAISGRESVEVRACGKNLFDVSALTASADDTTCTASGNSVRVYTTGEGGTWRGAKTPDFAIHAGMTYTLSATLSTYVSGYARVGLRGADDNTFVSGATLPFNATTGKLSVTYTPDADDEVYLSILCTSGTVLTGDCTFTDIQLEVGGAATAYEPYRALGGGTATPTEPLYGLPGAEDTVEVSVDGDVLATHRTGVFIADGDQYAPYASTFATPEGVYAYTAPLTGSGAAHKEDFAGMCSHFTVIPRNAVQSERVAGTVMLGIPTSGDGPQAWFFTTQATAEAFNAWLQQQDSAGTPVTLVYELAVPETEALTAVAPIAPQPGQLNIRADADALTATVYGSGWDIISDQTGLLATIAQLTARVAALEQAAVNESTGG